MIIIIIIITTTITIIINVIRLMGAFIPIFLNQFMFKTPQGWKLAANGRYLMCR